MRWRSGAAVISAFLTALLLGCGGSGLTVQVVQETPEGEPRGVPDHVVEFYPYDRDSLFQVLAGRAEEPEPQMPEDLRREFEEIAALQEEWRRADAQWAEVRDSLQQLSQRLAGMDRRSREYLQLYRRFTTLETRERELNRRKERAFQAFDARQRAALARADSVRAVIEAWEDVAFQDFPEVETALLEERERQVYQDTTGEGGYVTRRLPGGEWWVHSRLSTASGELYWNERIDSRQVDTLRLTRENAEQRVRL